MGDIRVNPNTLTVVPLRMLFNETQQELASGTGFVYNYEGKLYLITNWHNVTGENPLTGKPLGEKAGRPDVLVMSFLISKKPLQWNFCSIQLFKDNRADWLIHPAHGQLIDVVAIEIEPGNDFIGLIHPINDVKQDDFDPEIADDAYILGYPFSIKGGGNFPIWKRGTIATEPDINYDGLPKVLIDATCKKGMSGSPVIIKRNGILTDASGELNSKTRFGVFEQFFGVYSGRVQVQDQDDTHLGIVWKKKVIEEIIKGNKKDNRNFI